MNHSDPLHPSEDLILLDDCLWVLSAQTSQSQVYDFAFASFFPFERAWELPSRVEVVARIGAFDDYDARYASLAAAGLTLIHSPEQHRRASRLPEWYALLSDLTPESRWFDSPPTAAQIEAEFGWPVFLKGERQTFFHKRSLSIIRSASDYEAALVSYRKTPPLNWQRLVVRRLETLRLVEESSFDRVPSAFEFRTFWWRGELAGVGPYWHQGASYSITDQERTDCLTIAADAAKRVAVPFLVIDVAQRADGRWIVIECNDGQESGYVGVNPVALWTKILEYERRRH